MNTHGQQTSSTNSPLPQQNKTRRLALAAPLGLLLMLGGCRPPPPDLECISCRSLSAQNDRLQTQIAEKEAMIEDLRNKQGYLVVATWVAAISAFGLLAVGIAIGVRIKDEIITLKDVKSADSEQ